METKVMTLTDFLLARIAEDEAYVKNALRSDYTYGGVNGLSWNHDGLNGAATRIHAECEAKRRIVEMHESIPYYGLDRYGRWLPHEGEPKAWYCECQSEDGMIQGEAPCPTMRILAAVYADHPDYREEWKP